MTFDFGSIASGLGSGLDAAVQPIFDWWLDPSGDPPMVEIEQTWLLPTSHDYVWKKRPAVWPQALLTRPLVLVSASGGIDSTAAALAARRRWPRAMILLERSDTGREPSDSEAILRRLSRVIGAPVITMKARNELFDLIRWKGLIPNTVYGDWCTGDLKGAWLDRLNYWLVANRRRGSTKHTIGYLWGEGPEVRAIRKAMGKRGGRDRVRKHMTAQVRKFGRGGEQLDDGIEELVILHEEKIDKAGETMDPRVPKQLRAKESAVGLIQAAGLPISRVYLDRTRHGCIPCKWWDEKLWRAYYWVDPEGFEQAAQLEEEIAREGSSNPASKYHGSERPPIALRTWLLPQVKNATKDDGRTLRQWVEHWRAEGKLDHPPQGLALVRAEDLGEVDPGDRVVHLPTFREGRRNRWGRVNMHPAARTAISRPGASAPVKALQAAGKIKGRVLDYGSGRGGDARWLRKEGFAVTAFDPHHGPKKVPAGSFDTVLVTYVLNVLPKREQDQVVDRVKRLLAPGGKAYITVRRDVCDGSATGVQSCVRRPWKSSISRSDFQTYELGGAGRANKQVRGDTYVHRSALSELSAADRRRIRDLEGAAGFTWDVARVGPRGVMLGKTTSFGRPHPRLQASATFKDDKVLRRAYKGASRPIYHRVEQLLPPGPLRDRHAALSQAEEAAGLLGRPDIGTERAWNKALKRAGYRIEGFHLVRGSGRANARRKHAFTGWSCPAGPGELVDYLVDNGEEVDFEVFAAHADLRTAPLLDWQIDMLPTDWSVTFLRTTVPSGVEVWVLQHGGVEHLFATGVDVQAEGVRAVEIERASA